MRRYLWILALGMGCEAGVVLDSDKDNTIETQEDTAQPEPSGEPSSEPSEEPDPNDLDDDNDGFSENQGDCDDTDASISPDETEIPNDGIDQNCDGDDLIDADLDGFSLEDDCNDSDGSVYPGASEVPDDGIDQDCNGIDLSDGDGDGFFNDVDCDDTNGTVYPEATEICDGLYNDCNAQAWSATQPPVPEQDLDSDGYVECNLDPQGWMGDPTVVGGDDCDDNDASLNYDDVDGDGFASCPEPMCFTLDMQDTYGDGWNGGTLSHYENGAFIDDYTASGYGSSLELCVSGLTDVLLVYTAGAWEEENSYTLTSSFGDLFFEDGPYPQEGDVFDYRVHAIGDCNDNDPSLEQYDLDQDGYTACGGDCDDLLASLNLEDGDGDGETTCDGDCDDSDSSVGYNDIDGDGFGRCAQECYSLELIDQWADGWSGGMLTVQVEGVDWRIFEAYGSGQTETFCLLNGTEFSMVYSSGQWEQDNFYTLYDSNGDILFSDGPYPVEGVVFDGTVESNLIDCDDHNTSIYPGAAYLDSSTECLADIDGDGYGAIVEQCYILDLIDTNQFWDETEIVASVNGIEVASWTNLGGGEESYSWCYDSGTLEFSYECSSTYDCENQTYYLYDDDGTLLVEDGLDVTGVAPSNGVFWVDELVATDCDDGDSNINMAATDSPGDGVDSDCDGVD
ncbi:MAG: putative metal-binding motif-containing protein [Myxococcota bacterium]